MLDTEKLKQLYTKLVGDINQLESRKDAIKGKIAVAKETDSLFTFLCLVPSPVQLAQKKIA